MSDTPTITPPTHAGENHAATARHRGLVVMLVAVLVALVAFMVLALVVRSGSQPTAGTQATAAEAQDLRDLDQTLRAALVASDTSAVERILAPDFELVPPPGDKESRQEYLDSLSSGDLDYIAFEPTSPVDVQVSGSLAVLTYQSHLEVAADGTRLAHEAWHTHVYEKLDDRWMQVWAQATAVGGFPPP